MNVVHEEGEHERKNPFRTGEQNKFASGEVDLSSEVELVRRCLSGDTAGIGEFISRFQGSIFGLCLKMLRHQHDAEDVTQEVLTRAFRSMSRWDPTRPLKPWLLTIAANRCRTALSLRRRHPAFHDYSTELPSKPVDTPDWKEEVELALESLREEYRACFTMFYYEELSCQEIGELLDCPPGTVKTWLHRARREVLQFLQSRGLKP